MAEKKIKKLTQDELAKFNGFINKRKDILTSLGATELQLKNLKDIELAGGIAVVCNEKNMTNVEDLLNWSGDRQLEFDYGNE